MRLAFADAARSDLERIDQRLHAQAGADVAVDQLQRIRRTAGRLRDFPGAGPALTAGRLRTLRVRGTPYSIVYAVLQEEVRVLRIFHGAQNWRVDPE